jgi:MFS family permease
VAQRRWHPAWFIAAVAFFTLLVVAGFRSAPSVLIMPLEMAFGWSRTQISLAVSLNVLVYGLISPFAAALMEKFGIRRVVMRALVVIATGALLTTQITAPWQLDLLWGLVVGGGTGSMALVFSATIASRWFVQRRGLVVGMLSAANSTGQLVFLPIFAWLVGHHGWRSVSIAVGGFALFMVPLVWRFLREHPSEFGVRPYGAPDDWVAPPRPTMSAGRLSVLTLRESMRRQDFWILAGTFFVCGFSTNGLIGTHFIPACMDAGMPMQVAANLLAVIGVFDITGTMLSGWLSDRMKPHLLLF